MLKNIIFLICSCASLNLFAAAMTGAVSSATGGTGRGAAEPIDSILLNPSIVSQLPTKFFSFNYNKDRWGITLADNGKEALFPAALAFVKTDLDLMKTQQAALVLSYPVWKNISIGTNISFLEYSPQQVVSEPKFRQTISDFGISYITKDLGLGFVANKVFSSDSDLADALEVQKTLGLGISYTYMNFIRFRFDTETAPDNKTDRLVYMGGLETYMNDWVIFRLGYQNNNVAKKNYATAGLGFAGPQFGLHYGYISNTADSSDDKHSIDLGIPF